MIRRHKLTICAVASVLLTTSALCVLPHGWFKSSSTAAASFDPASLGTLKAWWKADSFSLPDGSPIGGAGTNWLDQSGNGNHLTQSTAGTFPTYETSVVNGKPVIRFDGTDDFLTLTTTLSTTNTTGTFTFALVMAQSATDRTSLSGVDGSRFQHSFFAGNHACQGDAGLAQSDAFTVTESSFKMIVARRSGASALFRENKTARGGTGSCGTLIFTVLGKRAAADDKFLNGDIAELLVYRDTLSDAACDTLYDSYLKPKYGLP